MAERERSDQSRSHRAVTARNPNAWSVLGKELPAGGENCMPMPSVMRTFVAVPISRHTAEALSEIRKSFRAHDEQIRWAPPHQYHITLKFLGDVERSKAPEIVEAVRSAATRGALALAFQGVGAFPDWRRPRVIGSRVTDGAGELTELARAVQSAIAAVVPPVGGEAPFFPHVTLGRIKSRQAPEGLYESALRCSDVRVGPEVIDRVVVYESRLSPRGAVHLELESVPLGPAAGRADESRN